MAGGGDSQYAQRLVDLQTAWWKRLLPVQAPYRWNLRRLRLGFTLDLGCGIGRNLLHLRGQGVGIDTNPECVAFARSRGLGAYTPEEFRASPWARRGAFDSLLAAHVLEHMEPDGAVELLSEYLAYVRPGGRAVLVTPQERGYASDPTHVAFLDFDDLGRMADALGLRVERAYSFPLPRRFGRLFVYNEFVVVARTPTSDAT